MFEKTIISVVDLHNRKQHIRIVINKGLLTQ